jgi:hypothetical protein
MGGRLEVRRASCDKCNRIFGVAEAAVKTATTPLLNLLRIKNRYGKVPNAPLRAEIQGLDLKNLPAFMDGNGEIRLQDYVNETVTDDGRKLWQGFFITKKAGEKFAARHRAKGQLIKRGVPKRIVIEATYTQKITFAFSLEARKVAAKIALAAIARKYGIPFALSPQFDVLRQVRDEMDTARLPVRIFANKNIQSAWLRTPHQHSVL